MKNVTCYYANTTVDTNIFAMPIWIQHSIQLTSATDRQTDDNCDLVL